MSYGSFLGEWIVPQNVDVGFVVDIVGNNEVVDTVDHYYYDTMHRDRMCTPLEAQNDMAGMEDEPGHFVGVVVVAGVAGGQEVPL